GLLAVRAKRFRVVYQLQTTRRTVIVVAVGPRDTIYEHLASAIRAGDLVVAE
ncbi:MAG: hypothetical protein HY600_01715, partial [Candidatus Omnitrophica bacterium]|nr:hypothetical protein [Candidatus Omnitrophota bacterium]